MEHLQVVWFVSNCRESNTRQQQAHELQKYIAVDIYGKCGTMQCPRSRETECFEKLNRDYKFFLTFENANCKDYVTEKLSVNSLWEVFNCDGLALLNVTRDCCVLGWNPSEGIYFLHATYHWTLRVI